MDSRRTPWSWQPPPLPPGLVLLNPTDTPPSMIWHRPFWGIEALSAWISQLFPGITDIILSCQLSLNPTLQTAGTLDHNLIRNVTRSLRFEHPAIASRYVWPEVKPCSARHFHPKEGRFAYEIPRSEQDIDAWLSEVVFDRSDVLVAANNNLGDAISRIRHELGAAAGTQCTTAFQLHHILSTSGPHAIILCLGHTLFDAIGAFQLMELFFGKLVKFLTSESIIAPQLACGEEVGRLAGPFPDRSTVSWSEHKVEQDNEMVRKLHEAMSFTQQAHGLPIPYPEATASTTGTFFRSVSPKRLSNLLRIMRHHGCTMFSVLFAIEMLALLRVNPPTRTHDITTPFFPSAHNLRTNYLRNDQRDRNHWEVSSSLAFNIIMARDLGRFILNDERALIDDVFVLAKEVHAQLGEQRQYMDRASFWVDDLCNAIIASASSKQSGPPPVPVPTLSSLGVVDSYLSSSHTHANADGEAQEEIIRVTNPIFSVRTPYMPHGFPLVLHPYTWHDTLHISFSFPEAYMGSVEELMRRNQGGQPGPATVLDFIEEFMRILESVAEREAEDASIIQ